MRFDLGELRRSLGLGPGLAEAEADAPDRADLAAAKRRAEDLAQLIAHPGWQCLLDLMEKRLDSAEHAMLQSTATDGMELLGLQRRARAYREMFDGLQTDVLAAIEDGRRAAEDLNNGE